ncbi:MAG: phosphate ABC transporter substrate-binding/OmpA family protein [Cyanobacteriota bacterium]
MAGKVRIPPIVFILLAGLVGWGGHRYWQSNGIPTWIGRWTNVLPGASGSQDWLLLGDTFSGYSTFRNTEFQAALQEVNIQLRYEDEFDQTERAQRLNRGQADLLVTSLDQFLQQQPQGQIIALIDRTVGADAVVLNTVKYPGLTSLLVLERLVANQRAQGNRLIATHAGDTPSEYLALVLDTKFDAFRLADFQVVPVTDASEAWELLQDRARPVGLAVLWEPYVTQARQRGYTVVLSSRDAPDTIVDVLVASERLIQRDPEALSDLVEVYYRRIDANVRDASQLQAQIAADGELTADEAAAVLQGIEFFTATEAQTWFNEGTLERRIQSTAAVLTLSGRLRQVPAQPQTLFTNAFVTRAARNNQTLIDLVRADNPELAERLAGKTRAITPTLTAGQIQAAPSIGNLEVRGEVQFATGSAQLTGASAQTLDQLLQEIREFSPQTVGVRVIGHTSRTGPAPLNQTLSQQRAQVVVNYLKERGLPHNLLAEGRGFEEPLPDMDPADARNQRTEIRLVRVD